MAIGANVISKINGNQTAKVAYPGSLISEWVTVIDAGGPAAQDNSGTVTNPTTHITASTRHIFEVTKGSQPVAGTILRARLGYDDGLTVSANPIIAVFGRANSSDVWMALPNLSGAKTVTLTTASGDVEDGTLKYTHPSKLDHAWDIDGCNEIIVGVLTALAGTGVTNNSILQVKVI